MVITPTNGRIVWYTPSKDDGMPDNGGVPLAAIVVHVWNDRMVNLAVFNSNGLLVPRTSVQLVQEKDDVAESGGYCEWMPYQKGQAAKYDELAKKVGGSA